jgi:putative ABC transport system permease protein
MPLDSTLAWRNIWRHPRRSLLTMGAIAFACVLLVFMLSFQFGSYDTMIDFAVGAYTGFLQVQAKGFQARQEIRRVIPDPASIGRMLDRIPGVRGYTDRAQAFALVSSRERTHGALVIGIDPAGEARVSTLRTLIRRGRYLEPADRSGALVGEILARNLQVGPGDELVLLGQGRDGSVAATTEVVRGIFRSGQDDFDRSSLQIPLWDFDGVFSMAGGVHEVVVVGNNLDRLGELKHDVSAGLRRIDPSGKLVVLDWKQLMPGLVEGITIDLTSGMIFYLILVVVVAFSILNTFLMAVLERTREFGVMMALGTTPGRLTRMLMLESALMTLLGVTAGVLIGAAITAFFQARGIVFSDTSGLLQQYGLPDRLYPRLSPLSLTIGPSIVFGITFLTALLPALRVRRLRPVEAITHA